jgi:hypothetical protein
MFDSAVKVKVGVRVFTQPVFVSSFGVVRVTPPANVENDDEEETIEVYPKVSLVVAVQ